jgi:NADH-quinone oxidoreductase subunit J
MLSLFAQSPVDQILAGDSVGSAVVRSAFVLLTGAVGVYLMLPRGRAREENQANRWIGGALCLVALALMLVAPVTADLLRGEASLLWPIETVETVDLDPVTNPPEAVGRGVSFAFFLFAGISLVSAVMMISSRNPVYSALWFALVLLANSGLYFLQGAEFLAASTIIIYAGAIIVTFLFVVMLAQPRGTAAYDRRSREPLFTCVAGLLISAAIVGTLHYAARAEGLPQGPTFLPGYQQSQQYAQFGWTSRQWNMNPGVKHVKALGLTLYTDHVVAVEAIGLLLLAAVVGAMLIAGHRLEKT